MILTMVINTQSVVQVEQAPTELGVIGIVVLGILALDWYVKNGK